MVGLSRCLVSSGFLLLQRPGESNTHLLTRSVSFSTAVLMSSLNTLGGGNGRVWVTQAPVSTDIREMEIFVHEMGMSFDSSP